MDLEDPAVDTRAGCIKWSADHLGDCERNARDNFAVMEEFCEGYHADNQYESNFCLNESIALRERELTDCGVEYSEDYAKCVAAYPEQY